MTRARVLQEVRPMRVEELYERRQQRSLTMAEAGELRGVTERSVRRGSGRDHAEGAAGLQARRIGRLSARVVPVDAAQRMVTRADATTEIYSAFFVEAAGTRSRVRGLREGMEPPGRVRSFSPRPGCARRAHRGGGRPRRQASVDAGAPHRAGPTARSVGAGRDSGAGGGQPVSARARSPAASYPVSGGGHGTGPRLLPRGRPAPRRDSVCARGAGRGPGEYGAVAGAAPADPAESPPVP